VLILTHSTLLREIVDHSEVQVLEPQWP
jgi:hypothetical protein